MADKSIFENSMASWRAQQEAPWGRLRYRQAEANLVRHLGAEPLRVLDVAGGNGADAIPLARRGHHVTVLDYSGDMLAGARAFAAEAGVADLIDTIEADVMTMPVELGSFDVVLCHNLMQYFADPAEILPTVLSALRPGGVLSLLSLNRETELLRLALREHDPAAALATLGERVMTTKTFGHDVTLSSPDEMIEQLARCEAKILGWYGIRAVCDYITDNEIKYVPEFYDALERLEFTIADHPTYRQSARVYQIISKR